MAHVWDQRTMEWSCLSPSTLHGHWETNSVGQACVAGALSTELLAGSSPSFLKPCLSLTWSWLIWRDWLAREPEWCSCVCLSSPDHRLAPLCAPPVHVFWDSNPSSGWDSKSFTDWAIFIAPDTDISTQGRQIFFMVVHSICYGNKHICCIIFPLGYWDSIKEK